MRRLRLYLRLLRIGAVVLLGVLLAAAIELGSRIGVVTSMERKQRLTQWFLARLANALPLQVRVIGECPGEPMLWVANHISWSDIPLLGALLPMSFLAKAEVRQWAVLGWLAHQAGTLFIRRGAGDTAQVNRELASHLRDGRHLLIFPEGTSTAGNTLRTFHSRLFACAVESGCAIQPVAIRYLRDGEPDPLAPFVGDDDLLSHLRRLLAGDLAEVKIQLLQPIRSENMRPRELASEAQDAIVRALFGAAAELDQAA
ncbi:1-acyl-sn-glycerol-3-phosphate acyltransferase [Stutzerimonas stutzeri]|uniref:lysophospholipid acyltransferase family protein n=1 Tax=Stutzerimonas sp. S1 TaxID=3030652 RepID=UPI0022250458|nr:lysophospholipid acyltransferase family protein [Stutzerimonas sp. S1]MCW3149929.1 1-acyl-sn-glycerol-3-phosphate acyltransferase [Stutzerimonas sp. S1]